MKKERNETLHRCNSRIGACLQVSQVYETIMAGNAICSPHGGAWPKKPKPPRIETAPDLQAASGDSEMRRLKPTTREWLSRAAETDPRSSTVRKHERGPGTGNARSLPQPKRAFRLPRRVARGCRSKLKQAQNGRVSVLTNQSPRAAGAATAQ